MTRTVCLIALALLAFVRAAPPESVLVVRPAGPRFEEAMQGLRSELGAELPAAEKVIGAGGTALSAAQLSEIVIKSRPRAVVLMDNEAIGLYAAVQAAWRDSTPYPLAVALMAVRVDRAVAGLKRATGIAYEVPGVTTFVNLRSLVAEPVRKVGVITRPGMEDFVRANAKWCAAENIELVPYVVPEGRRDVAKAVRDGVRGLGRRQGVDALWVLNDNYFLTPEIIAQGWLPALERFEKPVLVGVENFVSAKARFGTFAVLPDPYGLGAQAAGVVHAFREDGWVTSEAPAVEQPLAVYKLLNLRLARKYSRLHEQRLMEIDKVVK